MTQPTSKILLMIPHLTLRKTLRNMLQELGYNSVHETESPDQAEKILRAGKISNLPFDTLISAPNPILSDFLKTPDIANLNVLLIATVQETRTLRLEFPRATFLMLPFRSHDLKVVLCPNSRTSPHTAA